MSQVIDSLTKFKGSMNVEKLIRLVEERSFIYDKTIADFKNQTKKYYAWQEIASDLGITTREAQNKWKLLREKYGKEKRLVLRGCTPSETGRKEWEFYHSLKFLDAHIIGRKSSASQFPIICQSHLSDSQGSEEYVTSDIDENEVEDGPNDIKPPFLYTQNILSSPVCSVETQQKPFASSTSPPLLNLHMLARNMKRKANAEDTYINNCSLFPEVVAQKISKEAHVDDESNDIYFGKDIVCELAKMRNLKKKRQLKAKIYALISEYDSDE